MSEKPSSNKPLSGAKALNTLTKDAYQTLAVLEMLIRQHEGNKDAAVKSIMAEIDPVADRLHATLDAIRKGPPDEEDGEEKTGVPRTKPFGTKEPK